jgi:hypothetical protein
MQSDVVVCTTGTRREKRVEPSEARRCAAVRHGWCSKLEALRRKRVNVLLVVYFSSQRSKTTRKNAQYAQLAADSGVMFACDEMSGSLNARIVVALDACASAPRVEIPAAFHCIA